MSFLDKEFNNFDGNYLKLLDYISEIWNGNKNLDSFFKFVFQKFYRA